MLLRKPDAKKLESWFRRRFPEAPDHRIAKMRRLFPGLSRETWLVDMQSTAYGKDQSRRYVLRTQLPGNVSLTHLSLEHEAKVYQVLEGTDVPVPPFYGYEEAADWLLDGERPFFVRGWTEGVLEPAHIRDPDKRYDDVRVSTMKELIRRLAQVHRLDWQSLKLNDWMPTPRDPADIARFMIDETLRDYQRHHHEPFPVLVEALLTLRENPPTPPPRIALLKENCGLGDEVWAEDGVSIIAMCDWETARLGDPASDIATAMRSTGWCWDLPSVLDWYEELTGDQISVQRVQYYSAIWYCSIVAALHGRGVHHVLTGRDRRVQLLSCSLVPYAALDGIAKAAGF